MEGEPNLNSWQLEWNRVLSTATQDIVMLANSVKTLSLKVPLLNAQASLNVGYSLMILAEMQCAGRFDAWSMNSIVSFKF